MAAVGRAVVREVSAAVRRRSARASEDTLLDQLSFLADASLVLGTSLEPRRVIDMIAALAVPRLGDGAIVWLREDDSSVSLAGSMFVDPRVGEFFRAAAALRPASVNDDTPPGVVIRTGQSYYIPRYSEELARRLFPGTPYESFWKLEAGPTITVPMFSRGQVLGALTVGRYRHTEFLPTEVGLIEELARRGAAALDNARLFRDAEESALTLQRSLLPAHPPALEGMEIATEYRPGTAGTEVGGDLYDVIPLPDGRAGVAIGDVMGRGLRAAAVMGQLRAALRAYALEGWGPAELLSRLDRVVDSLPGLQLATCMYAVYDPRAGRATIANAGHLAPLLLLPDEEPDYLVVDPGLPLGMGENGSFQETTVALPPGAAFVMFTDGLVESRRRSLADGLEHLRLGMREQMVRPPAGPPPGLPRERRSGLDRRRTSTPGAGSAAGVLAWDRRRGRQGFTARSWSGPQALRGGGTTGPGEESARSLLERCLLAADLPARTDDDTALLVLLATPRRPPLLEIALPAEPESAGRAREAVERALAAAELDGLDDVLLLVSEVVTNAVLHARSDFVLRANLEPGRLRMSVEDREGGSMPRRGAAVTSPLPDAEHGWGLLLVETLAEAWGVETTPDGKRVWFEVQVPSNSAAYDVSAAG